MTLYEVGYDPRTEGELRKLSLRMRRKIDSQLEYLRASPFRSHPGVETKPTADVEGIWHFHAARDVRVYYLTVGPVLWVVMVERGAGITSKTTRELQRRLRPRI